VRLSPGFGPILEELGLPAFELTIWKDLFGPVRTSTGRSTVWYVPIDMGVRGTLGVGAVRPFIGVNEAPGI
jgi:hypothetical protein